jgi:hypothetical protein
MCYKQSYNNFERVYYGINHVNNYQIAGSFTE